MASGRAGVSSGDERRSVTAAEPAPASRVRRLGAWFLHELREILPPVIFFLVGFNLIILTTNLILADYAIAVGNFMLATAAGLVVGKAVLVADAMPFLGRYDRAPLLEPILYKTLVYWVFVFIARLLEALVEFLMHGHSNRLFGQGELRRIFLTHRPSEPQLNRRQRIRELLRLSHLADAHSLDELRDPSSTAHRQLVEIVRRLAR